ncbi:FecR domain-containing protein [Sphingomonas sanguinis]|uniref:FecR domain-containing protein n=1 Tax=Sphingomonas sanguinis TaxID=33051 RepID=A0ABU5LNJ2_9SPHN|nr:FecR domain-containing protein [Sphingomonas sanguinis]MDZ7281495.1 FecR domain-containing protein [Sphingomonas sanguinis]QXT36579.1 FecR domain-containing protein [Sphingomonas sanguinis]
MTREEQAIDWHVRQRDMSAAEWDAFATWLEDSPANARAYDVVAMADALLAEPVGAPESVIAETPVAANDNRGWGRWWLMGGVAAAVALMAGPVLMHSRPDIRIEQTRPGETRAIALNDGTQVELAGGSRLRLDRNDTRVATLESGQALFRVRHDASAPFELRSGDVSIRDMGTVFNVRREGARLDVTVAEGAVALAPRGQTMQLTAGQGARLDEAQGSLRRVQVDPAMVGGWRRGLLDLDGDTVDTIAARLQSAYGMRIAVEGPLAKRSVTGLVRVTGDASRDVPRLAKLIGAEWRQSGGDWILRASDGVH